MPRLVADQNLWHLSATMACVGQSEHPRRFEWELRSGASLAAIDSEDLLHYLRFHPKETDEGDRTGSFCHPCFLRSKNRFWDFQKAGSPIPRDHSKRPITQMWGGFFSWGGSGWSFADFAQTTHESFGPRHSLR